MLKPGDDAPDFELLDQDEKTWKLSELKGRKVILYFYPADDTPGCTVQACDFRDASGELERSGYVVLGMSPQGTKSKRRFADKYSLNFPLLADTDRSVAKAYGAIREKPEEWEGIKLHVKRSTFVIDDNGKIEQALYGVGAKGHVAAMKDSLGIGASVG
jgi:thioredoxin-dependent peroxiredoxin